MRGSRSFAILAIAALGAAACAPTTVPSAAPPNPAAAAPSEPRTLVMAVRQEPTALTEALGGGLNQAMTIRLFNAGLALVDSREVAHPYLAETLPQLGTPAWQLFPDGRMETTYLLKPNLTWHDGTALSGEDFVFAQRVYSTPQLGVAGSAPYANIDEILVPEPRTLVIRWKSPYSQAGSLDGSQGGLLPLPRHVLSEAFDQGPLDSFSALRYWTQDYLGLGPYRLGRWEPGAFLEAAGFSGHALGAPKIENVRVMFIGDPNTVLANLLAGGLHIADETTLGFSQALVLRREWGQHNSGFVLLNPSLVRMIQVQLKPGVASPRAVLDVRVRRALSHGVDKQALNEGLFEGQGFPTDTFVAPTKDYYSLIEQTVTKYPYDRRRAEQLLTEAGFTPAADGFHVSSGGERLSMEQWVLAGADNEKEVTVVSDGWRELGVETRMRVLSSAQNLDFELKATFPGLLSTGGPVRESGYRQLSTGGIPTRENNWRGGINQGGWSNPEYDRLLDLFNATLDRAVRAQHVAQMMKIVSDDVPWIPEYFQLRPMAHVTALTGPEVGAPESTVLWNVHQWDLRV